MREHSGQFDSRVALNAFIALLFHCTYSASQFFGNRPLLFPSFFFPSHIQETFFEFYVLSVRASIFFLIASLSIRTRRQLRRKLWSSTDLRRWTSLVGETKVRKRSGNAMSGQPASFPARLGWIRLDISATNSGRIQRRVSRTRTTNDNADRRQQNMAPTMQHKVSLSLYH